MTAQCSRRVGESGAVDVVEASMQTGRRAMTEQRLNLRVRDRASLLASLCPPTDRSGASASTSVGVGVGGIGIDIDAAAGVVATCVAAIHIVLRITTPSQARNERCILRSRGNTTRAHVKHYVARSRRIKAAGAARRRVTSMRLLHAAQGPQMP